MNRQFLCVLLLVAAFGAGARILGAPASPQEPTLADVLARAAKAAAAYVDATRIIYCDEHYKPVRYRLKQNMEGQFERVKLDTRPWVAAFAIAASPELEALGFDGNSGTKAQDAQAQLGPFGRSVLLPRVAALFLHAVNQPRFQFEMGGTRARKGVTLREVRFETKQGWTSLESPLGRVTMPVSGSFWIDQVTGSVHSSRLKFADSASKVRFDWMSITFDANRATGLWLPVSMEHQTGDTWSYETIEGKANYRNCRAVPRTRR
jgi:hypothetical protein